MSWIKNKTHHYYNLLEDKSIYQFGGVFIFILVGLFYFNVSPYRWFFLALIVLQLIGFKIIKILRVEYSILSLVTYPIGFITSTLSLIIIYILIIIPIGIFRKRKYVPEWTESLKRNDNSKMYE
jgi:hypothetical protein